MRSILSILLRCGGPHRQSFPIKPLLCIWVLLLCASACPADSLRWVAYSDLHYGSTWTWSGGTTASNAVWYAWTNHTPAFYLITGDISECTVGAPGVCVTNSYPEYIADFAVAPPNKYQVAGNHDNPNGGRMECWTNYFPARVAWTNGNYVFIAISAYDSGAGDTNGAVKAEDVDWMESVMSNSVPTYTNFITVEHYPLILDANTQLFGRLGGTNYTRYTNLLATYHVVLNLHGHTHSIDALTDVVPNTATVDRLVASLTRDSHGYYTTFDLQDTTLITRRYRWDTKAVDAAWTNVVPQYVADWPSPLPCESGPRAIRAYLDATANNVTLQWRENDYRQMIQVSRRVYTNQPSRWSAWVPLYTNAVPSLARMSGSFSDSTVSATVPYEYQISQWITNVVCLEETNYPYQDFQFTTAGTSIPLRDTNGNLILLVESGLASSIGSELGTLTNDLIGEGYKLYRHDVAAKEVWETGWFNAVTNTKAVVRADWLTATNADWTIFIVGHVPIPYSGLTSPGSHEPNYGAHPADWYYAVMDNSLWTDTTANDTTATETNCWNVPGDGKFDQSTLPGVPQASIGRVDLTNMTAFGKSDVQLMKQYLARDHAWRKKQFTARDRALTITNGLPFEVHGIYSAFFGNDTSTDLGPWLSVATNAANSYLFAASKGGGEHQRDDQLGYTTDFAATPLYTVFNSMYGSWYGDWDCGVTSNGVLMAPLCDTGYSLAVTYRENVIAFDPASMGEPIGRQLYATAYNYFAPAEAQYTSYGWFFEGQAYSTTETLKNYITLMGDPTLKYKVVAPPNGVQAQKSGTNNVVSWYAPSETGIQGYHVYRSPSTNVNSFTRLTASPVASLFYVDTNANSTAFKYLVRTVKLQDTGTRTYYDASGGDVVDVSGTNYWVATTGNDSNPGTQDQPFLTVQKGVDVAQAGDTVRIGSGTYAERVFSARSGTSAAPITIDGQGLATVAGFYLGDKWQRLQNCTIAGMTIPNGNPIFMDRGASFCVISNNLVNSEFNRDLGDAVRWNAPDTQPFGTNVASDNLIISNTLEHVIGVTVFSSYGDRNIFHGNRILDCAEVDWFRIWGRSNHIQFNVCSNQFILEPALDNHPDCVQAFGDNMYGSRWNVIEGNLFTGGWGFTQPNTFSSDGLTNDLRDFTFINNIFVDIAYQGSVAIEGVSYYNNLFLRCNPGLGGHVLTFTWRTKDTNDYFLTPVDYFAHHGRMFNNVFIDCGDSRTTVGWYAFDRLLQDVSADYNYVGKLGYQPVAVNPLHQSIGDAYWDYDTWWENHGVNGGDPKLVNTNNDFRIQLGSVLIGKGTNLSAFFSTDAAGLARPATGAWDIGPYQHSAIAEFQYSTNAIPITNPPRNLSIIGTARTGKMSL